MRSPDDDDGVPGQGAVHRAEQLACPDGCDVFRGKRRRWKRQETGDNR